MMLLVAEREAEVLRTELTRATGSNSELRTELAELRTAAGRADAAQELLEQRVAALSAELDAARSAEAVHAMATPEGRAAAARQKAAVVDEARAQWERQQGRRVSAAAEAAAAAAAVAEAAEAAEAEARGQEVLREGQQRIEQHAGSAVEDALRNIK